MVIHLKQSSRFYYDCLKIQGTTTAFYTKIALLLDVEPYFFPGYLEMLWNAEERRDTSLYNEVLQNTLIRINSLFLNRGLRKEWENQANQRDVEAVMEIISRALKSSSVSIFKKPWLWYLAKAGVVSLQPKLPLDASSGLYVKRIRTVDVSLAKEEVLKAAPYWWQVQTIRQESISHHQHTHAFVLRQIPKPSIEYTPVDGVHESVASIYGKNFPHTSKLIMQLAAELNIAVGRVAVVKMTPRAQAYRHCDNEPYLGGRLRFHLVLSCGESNVLESGDDKQNVAEGELLYFNNDVYHRAHNNSDQERIHVIFDGFPLGTGDESIK